MKVSTVFFITAIAWLAVFSLGVVLPGRPASLWMVLVSVMFFTIGAARRNRHPS